MRTHRGNIAARAAKRTGTLLGGTALVLALAACGFADGDDRQSPSAGNDDGTTVAAPGESSSAPAPSDEETGATGTDATPADDATASADPVADGPTTEGPEPSSDTSDATEASTEPSTGDGGGDQGDEEETEADGYILPVEEADLPGAEALAKDFSMAVAEGDVGYACGLVDVPTEDGSPAVPDCEQEIADLQETFRQAAEDGTVDRLTAQLGPDGAIFVSDGAFIVPVIKGMDGELYVELASFGSQEI